MYFEVIRSRSCDSLQRAQGVEINGLNAVVLTQGQKISLSNVKITQLEEVIKVLQEQAGNQKELSQVRAEKLKIRIRKMWRWIVIETGGLIVVVILLL